MAPSQAADLGVLRLQRGASVSGWVETEGGTGPPASCKAELSPYLAAPPDMMGTLRRFDSMARQAGVNDRGFFAFEGVPPGQYRLRVTHAEFAPAEIGPIEVRPGLETQIMDRIVLAKPVTFELILEPAVDPYGQAWSAELVAPSPRTDRFRGNVSTDGKWSQKGVFPGLYRLRVLDNAASRFWDEEVHVQAGQSPLRIELPLVEISGTVTRGREPLAATLWFGGSGGGQVRFDSDEEGAFQGFLPGEGTWLVRLDGEDGLRVMLDPVEVRRLPGKRVAQVEIVVPDTTLAGQVVDEMGRPVPEARLSVHHLQKKRKVAGDRFLSDADGKFRIRGLPAGPAAVQAQEAERTSDWAEVALAEGEESPWLRLVVRRNAQIRGRVVSASGPVAGAQLLGFPEMGQVGASSGVDTVTDPAGEFGVSVPSDTRALNVLVFAPGFALRMAKLPVSPQTPLEIALETLGGTLVLELPSGDGSSPPPLLVHGGTFFPPQLLSAWSRLQGAGSADPNRLVLPNVDAGEWWLCRGAVTALRQSQPPPAAQCASGFLMPNRELVLKTPPTPP